ncbi:hypothetical protein [Lysobacter gummosus]|uniref:hypothetical protein n=1 Tax=Lysobacter gummosus TaxID=262324 RepID=UPI00363339A1
MGCSSGRYRTDREGDRIRCDQGGDAGRASARAKPTKRMPESLISATSTPVPMSRRR